MTRLRLALLALMLCASTAEAQRPTRAPAPTPSAATVVTPAAALSGYDFFVVAGQSNAKGNGDMNQSERTTPGTAYEITRRGDLSHLADPVGGANTGSAWPAFAKAYVERTGRGVVLIPLSRPGTIQFKNSDVPEGKHWDIRFPDNLYDHSADLAARAYVIAEASLPDLRFGGWLWIQGGADAFAIRDGKQTREDYEGALHRMARQIDADWGGPLLHILTGSAVGGEFPEAQEVREVQADGHQLPEIVVIHHDAVEFADRGWHVDAVHWDQRGLNEAGLVGGDTAGRWRNGETIPDPDPRNPHQEEGSEQGEDDSAPTFPIPDLPTLPNLPTPDLPNEDEILSIIPNPSIGPPLVERDCEFAYEVFDSLGRTATRGVSSALGVRLPRRIGAGTFTIRTVPTGSPGQTCETAVARFTVLG
ncbi:MAG: sialate O-acetylesterase [Bacteroidota bacterium]